ncbi:MAG: GNAT family N-acetyltransferase [Patescibacteria group bacterium]
MCAAPDALGIFVVSADDPSAGRLIYEAIELQKNHSSVPVEFEPEKLQFLSILMRGQRCISNGVINLEGDTGKIRNLITHPKQRKLGLGSMALSLLEQVAETRAISRIWLTSMDDATSFYANRGYLPMPSGLSNMYRDLLK